MVLALTTVKHLLVIERYFFNRENYYFFLISAYLPPNPSRETCVHHYSIYIFEQIFYPLEFPELPILRSDFDFKEFLEDVVPHGAFCGPVASIEFESRF